MDISVIVPVYNVEKYLPKCIDSILAQTFTNFELLLINDGSKDSSGTICDEYAAKDSRIRVFHKENGGVSAARNLGLDNAKGEWIAFVDSDDWVDESYLMDLFQAADEKDMLVVQGLRYYSTINTIARELSFGDSVYKEEEIIKAFSEKEIHRYGYPFSKLYNKNLLDKNGLRFDIEIHFAEDMLFMFKYLEYVRLVKFTSNVNYNYLRCTEGGSTRYFSLESEFKLYKESTKSFHKIKGHEDLYFGRNVYSAFTSNLFRAVYTMYRPQNKEPKTQRIEFLKRIYQEEGKMIQQYYNPELRAFRTAKSLLLKQQYLLLDCYLSLLFCLRYSFASLWIALRSKINTSNK